MRLNKEYNNAITSPAKLKKIIIKTASLKAPDSIQNISLKSNSRKVQMTYIMHTVCNIHYQCNHQNWLLPTVLENFHSFPNTKTWEES